MKKQELIERIEGLPCSEGFIVDTIKISRKGLLELVSQLDESEKKVKIPQMVADWIDYCKENHLTITGAFDPVSEHGIGLAGTFKGNVYKCTRWALDNQNLFARAWLDGYTVEKEKRYTVVMKTTKQPLYYNVLDKKLFFSMGGLATKFIRKELEEAGFGWVFGCSGVEIEEVDE